MKIKLSRDELEKLFEAIKFYNLEPHSIHIVGTTIYLSEDKATELREICSEYLLYSGLSADYSANKNGALLNGLIDKLYVK